MKKLGAILSAAVLLIGAGTTDVLAGACAHGSHRVSCVFFDENNDGICDNCAGDICGSHRANCSYIDEDNDGICDNCAEEICPQNAVGRGHHGKKGGHHRHR